MNATAASERWIEPLRRGAVHPRTPRLATAVLAVAVGWQLAVLGWTLAPEPPAAAPAPVTDTAATAADSGSSQPDATARVASLQLFGAAPGNDAAAASQASAPADAPETQLNLTLRGVYAPGSGEGLAIISAGGGREKVYAVGDTIAGDARIAGIHADRVVLRRNGRAETLRMSVADAAPASGEDRGNQASSREREIAERARELRQRLLENPVELARMVRFQPYVQNGNLVGYRIQPRSADAEQLRALGLQPSDVVTSVNGRPLNDPRQANEALQSLRDARTIRITFLRNGQQRSMTIPIGEAG
jgi:general secretion pathway protein C